MKTIILKLDGINIIFHFASNEENYVRTQISIEAGENLTYIPILNSIETSVDIKDLKRLSDYLLSHIDDIENPKDILMGYHLLYEITAYEGEPNEYFDIQFSINMTEDATKAPRVYYGVRSSVRIDDVQRFVFQLEQLILSLG